MANKNRTECGCEGFYDESGSCLPYDPAVHVEVPCPPNPFWTWLGGLTTDDWIGGTNFGIQMCKLFGGCGNMGAGSYSDPNSPAYMIYMQEQRRKTNSIIIIGLVVAASLFYVAYKN